MICKYVIYDDGPENHDGVYEKFGFWWFCEETCDRPEGPYSDAAQAEKARAEHYEWLREIGEDDDQ